MLTLLQPSKPPASLLGHSWPLPSCRLLLLVAALVSDENRPACCSSRAVSVPRGGVQPHPPRTRGPVTWTVRRGSSGLRVGISEGLGGAGAALTWRQSSQQPTPTCLCPQDLEAVLGLPRCAQEGLRGAQAPCTSREQSGVAHTTQCSPAFCQQPGPELRVPGPRPPTRDPKGQCLGEVT